MGYLVAMEIRVTLLLLVQFFICYIGPPKGGSHAICYMAFYGFAICYNKNFNTAIIHFQLLLYKNVMVLYAIKIYTKNI